MRTDASDEIENRIASFLPLGPLLSFGVAIIAVVAVAVFSLRALQERTAAAESVTHTLEVIEQIQEVVSTLKDAETSQRGFLLTGAETYLGPYNNARAALPGAIQALRRLTADNERQQSNVDLLEQFSRDKMAELEDTIALRRKGEAEAALSLVRSDRGRAVMERLRAIVAEMDNQERELAAHRREGWARTADASLLVTGGGSLLLLALIAAAAVISSRNYRARETEAWLRAGQAGLAEELQGDRQLSSLGDKTLSYLARMLGAQVGAAYLAEAGGQRFVRFGTYALPAESEEQAQQALRLGDGLLGQAAKDRALLRVEDVPAGYLPVSSTLGRAQPAELLLLPLGIDGGVQAVLELGFLRATRREERQLLERVSESLAMALRAATDRSKLEALLEESQRQSEELQAQQEELEANNAELSAQHDELAQSNTQLEAQRADLARAQMLLSEKAEALTRTSRYKSEFLANMSHELRTPLNSTLILAKLLADNKAGNLTDEQVRFAQTISSAGNDLLSLINDILDISKIEAGKLELSVENVLLERVAGELRGLFAPLAEQRGLGFSVELAAGTPATLDTDETRLGQILRNLVSNALKFTERGGVTVRIDGDANRLRFAVQDSGIGIAPEHQELIFEAFQQADGSTQRRYGGTGLGLSISRTLARMLGGEIRLQSAPGQGSLFTLTLPRVVEGGVHTPAAAPAPVAPAMLPPSPLEDDREGLQANSRAILVIEDDPHFAEVLRDLVREMGFACVLAHTASDGLLAARIYQPSAVLLDMKLPDSSGFAVLEQLKRTPALRHIPVHVISISDYAQEALEMGAVGYALKPVKREELETALRRLEAKFSQGLRRVLVVEDDARQRESIEQLLAGDGVEITGVDTAGQALTQLRASSFDCMVMDLNLPDLSGYELLEQMAGQDNLAFPPVIVYTGRSLSKEQEMELRRFSKSIIIKGARSPERLLDEVTLFLHQVESQLPPQAQRMLQAVRERESQLEGRRVLIVEDDVRNIFALSAALEPKGVKVEIARNGREALAKLAATEVDLVLMDIMMPEMDGLTATREIRKSPALRKLPIIALTAKAMKDDHEKCLAAGANDYIAKPLDVEKLLSLMRVWIPR